MKNKSNTTMDNFGQLNGTPIANKNEILNEIDLTFGRKPCLEYIIAYPIGYINLPFGIGTLSYNSYGHSVLRYVDPDGNDVIANIEAKEIGKSFIQFYEPKEYLFGVNPKTCGSQRGIYNRNMVGIRVYGVPKEKIVEMHEHIQKLILMENDKIGFNIVIGPIINFINKWFPTLKFKEYGNCSKWTSTMLQKAGVLDKTFVWPRTIFIDIFEMAHSRGLETDIVFYEKPDHIKCPSLGVKSNSVLFEGVAPFQFTRNFMYGDLIKFSNIIVKSKLDLSTGQTHAIIIKNHDVLKPDKLRNLLNNKYVICINVSASMYLTYRTIKYINKIIRK